MTDERTFSMAAKKLFIIDLMPFLYKGHFVFLRNPRLTAGGVNTSALLGLVNGLQAILRREKPTHVVFAMDPGTPTFRHDAYPAYKAQREKMPEDIAASVAYAFELAEALAIPVLRVDGFEADDVMGTVAVKGAAAGFEVFLATPDKDAAQLVRPGVRLYRPAHAGDAASVYDEAGVREHWSLRDPAQMIDYLKANVERLTIVDADRAAEDLGSAKVLNVVLLGAALRSGELGLTEEDLENAIRERVPEKLLELNKKALAWN
jgi:DNA polymerase-1